MKTIGLVLLVLGLLLAAAGPLAMWWSFHSIAEMPEPLSRLMSRTASVPRR